MDSVCTDGFTRWIHYSYSKLQSYQIQLFVNINCKFTCAKCFQIEDPIHKACFDYTCCCCRIGKTDFYQLKCIVEQ